MSIRWLERYLDTSPTYLNVSQEQGFLQRIKELLSKYALYSEFVTSQDGTFNDEDSYTCPYCGLVIARDELENKPVLNLAIAQRNNIQCTNCGNFGLNYMTNHKIGYGMVGFTLSELNRKCFTVVQHIESPSASNKCFELKEGKSGILDDGRFFTILSISSLTVDDNGVINYGDIEVGINNEYNKLNIADFVTHIKSYDN